MQPLVLASHNAGKLREFQALLADLPYAIISAAELDLPEPEETGETFEANAAIKSESAAILSNHWSLSDDSGLCVVALNHAPGVVSARWAGAHKDFTMAIQRIHDELMQAGENPQGAAAYFVCVLALSRPNQETVFFRGEVHGTLSFPPRGIHGFGYDPIFQPHGYAQTFGEMEPAAKHALSHRAIALEKLLTYLQNQK